MLSSDDTPYGYYDFSDDEPSAEAPDVGEAPVDVLRRVGLRRLPPHAGRNRRIGPGGHDTIGLLPLQAAASRSHSRCRRSSCRASRWW